MTRSIAQIEADYQGQNLRNVVRDLMKANPKLIYIVNGLELTPGKVGSYGKKADLIKHISEWEGQGLLNSTVNEAVKSTKPIEAVETIEVIEPAVEPAVESAVEPAVEELEIIDYSTSEAIIADTVNKIYQGLGDIIFAEKSGGDAFLLACTLPSNCIKWIREAAQSEIPDTVLSYRSQIFTQVERKLTGKSEDWGIWYKRIRNAVYNSEDLGILAKSRAFRQSGTLQVRIAGKMTVNVTQAYDWALGVVSNLDKLKLSDWQNVVVALMALTGRRPQEITSTGIFEKSEIEGCVRFSGQLKRHKEEVVEAFDIPVIGGKSREVIDALFWLTTNRKRVLPVSRDFEAIQLAAKKAHNNFSKYISAFCKKSIYSKIEVINGDWCYQNAKGQPEDRREPSVFRKFYAQAMADSYREYSDRDIIISEILGHSDNSGAHRPYDADFKLHELSEIYTRHDAATLSRIAIEKLKARGQAKHAVSNEMLKA